jgi:predicted NodU family carbamoyl transferase
MGLAPYGEPRYVDLIKTHLIDIKPDGTFRLDMRYFDYATGPNHDQSPLRYLVWWSTSKA